MMFLSCHNQYSHSLGESSSFKRLPRTVEATRVRRPAMDGIGRLPQPRQTCDPPAVFAAPLTYMQDRRYSCLQHLRHIPYTTCLAHSASFRCRAAGAPIAASGAAVPCARAWPEAAAAPHFLKRIAEPRGLVVAVDLAPHGVTPPWDCPTTRNNTRSRVC